VAVPGADTIDAVGGPRLPLGQRVVLPGRGTTFVREVEGPPGAPTVLLLHGWVASAGLNWFTAFQPLGARYRVLAVDHRGHGRGIRSRSRFRLADCADDAAAVVEQLGGGPVVAVGYSLGGPVAQLLWRRHPEQVRGLVLAATSHSFVGTREQLLFGPLMAAAAGGARVGQFATRLPGRRLRSVLAGPGGARPATMREWARAEMRRHDPRQLMEAGMALASYRAPWVDRIAVPTAVIVTTRDRAVEPAAQLRMARRIPGASVHRVEDGHLACAHRSFAAVLLDAVDDVIQRPRESGRCSTPALGPD
jgi:pimeloyl-ACP methyl ester carboxylesterase